MNLDLTVPSPPPTGQQHEAQPWTTQRGCWNAGRPEPGPHSDMRTLVLHWMNAVNKMREEETCWWFQSEVAVVELTIVEQSSIQLEHTPQNCWVDCTKRLNEKSLKTEKDTTGSKRGSVTAVQERYSQFFGFLRFDSGCFPLGPSERACSGANMTSMQALFTEAEPAV